MPYSIEMVKDGEYVSLVHVGKPEGNDADNSINEAYEALVASHWNKLFVGATQAEQTPSTIGTYEFLKVHRSKFPRICIALLIREDDTETATFIENVA